MTSSSVILSSLWSLLFVAKWYMQKSCWNVWRKEQKGCRWISATGDIDSTKILIKINHIEFNLCVTCTYTACVHSWCKARHTWPVYYGIIVYTSWKKKYNNCGMILIEEINSFDFFKLLLPHTKWFHYFLHFTYVKYHLWDWHRTSHQVQEPYSVKFLADTLQILKRYRWFF